MGKCNKRSLAKKRISRKKRSTKKLRSGGMGFLSYFSSNPSSQQKSSPSDQSEQLVTCKSDNNCLERITELSQLFYKDTDTDMKTVYINMMNTLKEKIRDSEQKQKAELLISQCQS